MSCVLFFQIPVCLLELCDCSFPADSFRAPFSFRGAVVLLGVTPSAVPVLTSTVVTLSTSSVNAHIALGNVLVSSADIAPISFSPLKFMSPVGDPHSSLDVSVRYSATVAGALTLTSPWTSHSVSVSSSAPFTSNVVPLTFLPSIASITPAAYGCAAASATLNGLLFSLPSSLYLDGGSLPTSSYTVQSDTTIVMTVPDTLVADHTLAVQSAIGLGPSVPFRVLQPAGSHAASMLFLSSDEFFCVSHIVRFSLHGIHFRQHTPHSVGLQLRHVSPQRRGDFGIFGHRRWRKLPCHVSFCFRVCAMFFLASHTSLLFRSVVNASSVVCTLPAGQGSDKTVTFSSGIACSSSGAIAPSSFSYAIPTITSLNPSSNAEPGLPLTIIGTSFGLTPAVSIDGLPCVIQSSTHTKIVCQIPIFPGSLRFRGFRLFDFVTANVYGLLVWWYLMLPAGSSHPVTVTTASQSSVDNPPITTLSYASGEHVLTS